MRPLHSSTSAGWLRSDSSLGSSSPPARAKGAYMLARHLRFSAQPRQTPVILLLAKRCTRGPRGWGSTDPGPLWTRAADAAMPGRLGAAQVACASQSYFKVCPVSRSLLFILKFTVPICLQSLPYGLQRPTCKALKSPGASTRWLKPARKALLPLSPSLSQEPSSDPGL